MHGLPEKLTYLQGVITQQAKREAIEKQKEEERERVRIAKEKEEKIRAEKEAERLLKE